MNEIGMKMLLLAIFCILLLVFGQSLLKYGLNKVGGVSFSSGQILASVARIISTPYILLGFVAYAASAVLWLDVLSKLDFSIAYPMVSISYIFSLIIGKFFFHEPVNMVRVLGVLLICAGVIFVARS